MIRSEKNKKNKTVNKNFKNEFIKSSTTTIHKVQVQKNSTVQ